MSLARFYSKSLRARVMAGDEPAWLRVHSRREYIIRCLYSFVGWGRPELRKMASVAKRRGLVLDHIIPVSHPYVCGLTVPENMQMIPRLVNAAKSNKWHPDQTSLAIPAEPPPHQLRLDITGRIAA